MPFGYSSLWMMVSSYVNLKVGNIDLSIGCVTNMQSWMPGYTCQQEKSYLNFNGFNSTYDNSSFVTLTTAKNSNIDFGHLMSSFDFGVYYQSNNSLSSVSLLNSNKVFYGSQASMMAFVMTTRGLLLPQKLYSQFANLLSIITK
jgi:hypothetical protein